MELRVKDIESILSQLDFFHILKIQDDIFYSQKAQHKLRSQIRKVLRSQPNTYMKLHQKQNQFRSSVQNVLKQLDKALKTKKHQFQDILKNSTLSQLYLLPKLEITMKNFQIQHQNLEQNEDCENFSKQLLLYEILERNKIKISLKQLNKILQSEEQRNLMIKKEISVLDKFIQFLQENEFNLEYQKGSEQDNTMSQCSVISLDSRNQSCISQQGANILQQLKQDLSQNQKLSYLIEDKNFRESEQNVQEPKIKLFSKNNRADIYKEEIVFPTAIKKVYNRQKNQKQIREKRLDYSSPIKKEIQFKKRIQEKQNNDQNEQQTLNSDHKQESQNFNQQQQVNSSQIQIQFQEKLSHCQMYQSLYKIKVDQIKPISQILQGFKGRSYWTQKIKVRVYGSIQNGLHMKDSNLNIDIGCSCSQNKSCKLCRSTDYQKSTFFFQLKQFMKNTQIPQDLSHSFIYEKQYTTIRMRIPKQINPSLIQNTYITINDYHKVQFSCLITKYLANQPTNNRRLLNFLKVMVLIFKKQKLIYNLNQMYAEASVKTKAKKEQNEFTPYSVQMMCLHYLVLTHQIQPYQSGNENQNENLFKEYKEKKEQIFVLESVDKNVIGFLNFYKKNGVFENQYARKKPIDIRKQTESKRAKELSDLNKRCEKYNVNILNPMYPYPKQKKNLVQILVNQGQKSKEFYSKIDWLYKQTQRKDFQANILFKLTSNNQ